MEHSSLIIPSTFLVHSCSWKAVPVTWNHWSIIGAYATSLTNISSCRVVGREKKEKASYSSPCLSTSLYAGIRSRLLYAKEYLTDIYPEVSKDSLSVHCLLRVFKWLGLTSTGILSSHIVFSKQVAGTPQAFLELLSVSRYSSHPAAARTAAICHVI